VGQAQRTIELPKATGSVIVRCQGNEPEGWTVARIPKLPRQHQ